MNDVVPKGTLIKIVEDDVLPFKNGSVLLLLKDVVKIRGYWIIEQESMLSSEGVCPSFKVYMC
jgi:hypothetical protein